MKAQDNTSLGFIPKPCLRTRALPKACFLTLLVFGLWLNATAQEQSIRPQIATSPEAKAKIRAGQKVAIVLSANDNLLGKLIEDAIAIQLSNAGYELVAREQLESVLAKRMASRTESTNEAAVSALDLAKAVNAELVITGAAVIGTSDLQSIMVKAASLQVLDVTTGKQLIQTLFDTKDGLRLTEISRSFLDVLNSPKK